MEFPPWIALAAAAPPRSAIDHVADEKAIERCSAAPHRTMPVDLVAARTEIRRARRCSRRSRLPRRHHVPTRAHRGLARFVGELHPTFVVRAHHPTESTEQELQEEERVHRRE